jgi:hypothetical protein
MNSFTNITLISLSSCTITMQIRVRIIELLSINPSILARIPIDVGIRFRILSLFLFELFTLLSEVVSESLI